MCDRRFKSIKWLKTHMMNDHKHEIGAYTQSMLQYLYQTSQQQQQLALANMAAFEQQQKQPAALFAHHQQQQQQQQYSAACMRAAAPQLIGGFDSAQLHLNCAPFVDHTAQQQQYRSTSFAHSAESRQLLPGVQIKREASAVVNSPPLPTLNNVHQFASPAMAAAANDNDDNDDGDDHDDDGDDEAHDLSAAGGGAADSPSCVELNFELAERRNATNERLETFLSSSSPSDSPEPLASDAHKQRRHRNENENENDDDRKTSRLPGGDAPRGDPQQPQRRHQ